jgi:hypothetical protein
VASIDPVTLAALVGTWVLVVGTLAFGYWQLRQESRQHSASTLLDLRERFYNARMRQARRELSAWLLRWDRGEEIENWEVAIFFELLGFLTRTHVLEERMVWSAFSPWITAYWTLMTQPVDLVANWRNESHDTTIFREYEWLAGRMNQLDRQLIPGRPGEHLAMADARETLGNETHLGESAIPGAPA